MTNQPTSPMTHRVEGNGDILVLERVFDAPPSLVFEAFAKAEHLQRWWSPGWSMPVCNLDFRPGGVWHYCMKCTDESSEHYGVESWGRAVYVEIKEPELLVFIDSFSDADGNVVDTFPSTKVTNSFNEVDGKTKLVSRSEYASADALKQVLDMGLLEGVTLTWNNLAALLAELQAA